MRRPLADAWAAFEVAARDAVDGVFGERAYREINCFSARRARFGLASLLAAGPIERVGEGRRFRASRAAVEAAQLLRADGQCERSLALKHEQLLKYGVIPSVGAGEVLR